MNTNTNNNTSNTISINQAVQFENGKNIFSIFYAPGLFANTPWTMYRKNCYRALNTDIKEVVKKAENNGWAVFNYTDLPDSWIWGTSNPENSYKEDILGYLDDILTICDKGGVDVTYQVKCITSLVNGHG